MARRFILQDPVEPFTWPWTPRFPVPSTGRAVDAPGVRWMLRRRLTRAAVTFAIGAVVATPAAIAVTLDPDMPGPAAAGVFLGLVVGGVIVVRGLVQAAGTLRLRLRLRRPWQSFAFRFAPGMWADRPWLEADLVSVDGHHYRISMPGGEETFALSGLPYPEVWFVGIPMRRGLLTPPGGPELFPTRGIWAGKPWLSANATSSRYVPLPRDEPLRGRRRRTRHKF